MNLVTKRVEQVREALDEAGRDLNPTQWIELLEEILTDIQGQLDAIDVEQDQERDHD
jgi:hypothetical protein